MQAINRIKNLNACISFFAFYGGTEVGLGYTVDRVMFYRIYNINKAM